MVRVKKDRIYEPKNKNVEKIRRPTKGFMARKHNRRLERVVAQFIKKGGPTVCANYPRIARKTNTAMETDAGQHQKGSQNWEGSVPNEVLVRVLRYPKLDD